MGILTDIFLSTVANPTRRAFRSVKEIFGYQVGPADFSELVAYNTDGGVTKAKRIPLIGWVIYRDDSPDSLYRKEDNHVGGAGVFFGQNDMLQILLKEDISRELQRKSPNCVNNFAHLYKEQDAPTTPPTPA